MKRSEQAARLRQYRTNPNRKIRRYGTTPCPELRRYRTHLAARGAEALYLGDRLDLDEAWLGLGLGLGLELGLELGLGLGF